MIFRFKPRNDTDLKGIFTSLKVSTSLSVDQMKLQISSQVKRHIKPVQDLRSTLVKDHIRTRGSMSNKAAAKVLHLHMVQSRLHRLPFEGQSDAL